MHVPSSGVEQPHVVPYREQFLAPGTHPLLPVAVLQVLEVVVLPVRAQAEAEQGPPAFLCHGREVVGEAGKGLDDTWKGAESGRSGASSTLLLALPPSSVRSGQGIPGVCHPLAPTSVPENSGVRAPSDPPPPALTHQALLLLQRTQGSRLPLSPALRNPGVLPSSPEETQVSRLPFPQASFPPP